MHPQAEAVALPVALLVGGAVDHLALAREPDVRGQSVAATRGSRSRRDQLRERARAASARAPVRGVSIRSIVAELIAAGSASAPTLLALALVRGRSSQRTSSGVAALGERDLDRVEVARQHGRAGTRPAPRRAARSAGSGSRSGSSASIVTSASRATVGRLCRRSSVRSRRLARAPPRRTSPRGSAGRHRGRRRGASRSALVSPEITSLRPGRGGPSTCSGLDAPDRLAPLQAAELGPGCQPQPDRGLRIERSRALVLVEHVAERGERDGSTGTGAIL